YVSPKKNNPHINSEELPAFMDALANAKIQPQTRFLVQFQMLTMTRPNEASGAQWSEIDLAKKLWTIPAERMKAREVQIIAFQCVLSFILIYSELY
ncbi:tyrosine-type recombinase/integrase, partial [Rodentibacter genomosp. 2]|uniref:tyrosine-type recombinase/integrase n=1 Tax=Rodentibacter genomosp. 2 TaxID=1908266 RepID=UPI001FC916AE